MFLKIPQLRTIQRFCSTSDCPLKEISKRLQDVRTGKIIPRKSLNTDLIELSSKTDIKTFENSLGRMLDIKPMREAQPYTETICNSVSCNKTMDCINDSIGAYGDSAIKMQGTKEYVEKVDNAIFNELSKTTKDVIAYRGETYAPHSARLQEILSLKPGDTLNSNRYSYFSENLNYAKHFQQEGKVKVLYKVLIPQKSNIALHTLEKGCAIAPRNSQHEIIDIKKGIGEITISSILKTP